MLTNEVLEAIELAVRQAGEIIRDAHPGAGQVEKKEGPANFVTEYDTAVQRFLIARFDELLPGAAYYGEEDTEENGRTGDGRYTFYIDPIDGTTNFMFGYGYSCVSVGLAEEGRLIAGWVYNPYSDELFHAVRGQGAFRNGERLTMDDRTMEEGIVGFGCARYNDSGAERIFAVVKELFLHSLAIREGGSAALDLCRIAAGANVAYFETVLKPYDYAAASVIIEEAGGEIGQLDGSPIRLDGPCGIIAGTKRAAAQIRALAAKML